jgi:putative PIN family toxin of toxin-antitoxin system
MTGIVLDTNVLISAVLKKDGLESRVVALALNKKVQMYVTEPIFLEYGQVLRYPRLKFTEREVSAFLTRLRQASSFIVPKNTLNISPHEPDNRFLECAEQAGADFLVSGNTKHFPNLYKKCNIVNARQFLSLLAKGKF